MRLDCIHFSPVLLALALSPAVAVRVRLAVDRRAIIAGAAAAPFAAFREDALAAALVTPEDPLCDPCVSILRSGSKEVVVVGTAHISSDSASLVRRVVRAYKPDVVMLELDARRAASLIPREGEDDEAARAAARTSRPSFGVGQLVGKLVRGDLQGAGSQAVGMGLSSMYRELDAMGFQSGAEFGAAVEEARQVNASILLGDQDARVTINRMRDALAETIESGVLTRPGALAEPPPLLAGAAGLGGGASDLVPSSFTKEEIERTLAVIKEREVTRELRSYLKSELPALYAALVEERDAFLARSLLNSDGKRIVAVVGLAHVDGIERFFTASPRRACRRPAATAA